VGAYRDDKGKPYVLPSVREAEKNVVTAQMDKEYAGITGVPQFTNAALTLAYGRESTPLSEGRIVVTQTISGTGALRIGGAFLERHYPGAKTIYIPTPSWANHAAVFKDSGLKVEKYRYYDKNTIGLDFDGMISDIKHMPKGSIILLHACAHNPTGVDPTEEQWLKIAEAVKEGDHFPFFDMAYQGFASGNTDKDAFALRHFIREGLRPVLAQSFAKNMGLYGERVGAFSVVCESGEEKKRVDSQIKILVRPLYSNPPVHGARIAAHILTNDSLHEQWLGEVKGMADRIITMRALLYENLQKLGSKHDWSHITSQIGMFAYTGLSAEQMDTLAKEVRVVAVLLGGKALTRMTALGLCHQGRPHLCGRHHQRKRRPSCGGDLQGQGVSTLCEDDGMASCSVYHDLVGGISPCCPPRGAIRSVYLHSSEVVAPPHVPLSVAWLATAIPTGHRAIGLARRSSMAMPILTESSIASASCASTY